MELHQRQTPFNFNCILIIFPSPKNFCVRKKIRIKNLGPIKGNNVWVRKDVWLENIFG